MGKRSNAYLEGVDAFNRSPSPYSCNLYRYSSKEYEDWSRGFRAREQEYIHKELGIDEFKEKLEELCKAYGVYLSADEVYGDRVVRGTVKGFEFDLTS
jgi:hypothetical protein